MPLDTARTTADSIADHLSDHNTLHAQHNLAEAIWVDADDNASTIQTKLDAGPIQLMEDVSIAATLDLDRNNIKIDLNGFELTSSANPVFECDTARSQILNGLIDANGGDTFRVTNLAHSLIAGVSVEQHGDHSVVECNGGNIFDTLITGGGEWITGHADMSVPMLNLLSSSGTIANLSVRSLRLQTNGNSGNGPTAPVIKLEEQNTSNWCYSNSFHDLDIEIPLAGALHLFSARSTLLSNIGIFDTHLGTIIDDLILLDKTPGGLNCAATTIINYMRNTGSMPTDPVKYDINVASHYAGSCLIDNPNGTGSEGVKINGGTVRGGYQVNP